MENNSLNYHIEKSVVNVIEPNSGLYITYGFSINNIGYFEVRL